MADVSNLKINERPNVECKNVEKKCRKLWVTKIEKKLRKLIYIKGKIWELAKLRIVRIIERPNKSNFANFFSQILVFQIGKILNFFLIFQFGKFEKLSICKIPKSFEILQFRKIANFQNFKIWKNIKIP